MPNALIATTFKQPTGITVSSERSGHPGFNLTSFTKWRRTWRSLDVSAQTIIFDFGVTTTLAGIFVNGCNFATYTLEGSANGSTWTTIAAALATQVDDRLTRKKVWSPSNAWGSAFNHRYLRVTPATVDAPSPGYFEIGAMAFPDAVVLTQNWAAPLRWTPTQAVTRSPFPGGGAESNVEGPRRLVYDLAGPPWKKAMMAQLLGLAQPAVGQPLFLYENRGDLSKAYIVERTEDVPFGESFATFEAAWRLEECM